MKHYIGIDIGRTAIKAGLIREDGKIIKRWSENVAMAEGQRFKETIWQTAHSVKLCAEDKGIVLSGIRVSSAGQINVKSGEVIGAFVDKSGK